MDTAAACIGPRCFKDMQSPAVQACRYMSLFCVKELAPAESLAAERSTLILAAAILPRLSELLFDALEIIWRSEKSDGRAQRDAGLRELALLYFCLNGVRRALEKGNVHPIIVSPFTRLPPPSGRTGFHTHYRVQGGSLFKSAFIERVSCWIQALQDNVAFACSRREVWWDCIGFENLEQLRFRHWAVKLRLVFEPCAHDTHDTMSEVSIASDQTRSTSILTDLYMSDVSEDHIRVPPAADEDRSAHYLFYADGLPSAPPRNGYGGDGFGSDILLGTIDELAAAGRAPPPMAASDLGPCTVEKHVGYYAPPGAVMVPSASTQILLLRTDAADDQLPPGTYLQTFLDHSQSYFQVNPGTAPWERFDNRCPLPTGAPSYGHLPVPPQSHQYPRTQQQQQQQHQQQQQNEQRQQQQPPLVSPPQQQPLQPQYADWPGINDNDFPNLRRHGYGSWQGPQYT